MLFLHVIVLCIDREAMEQLTSVQIRYRLMIIVMRHGHYAPIKQP